MTDDTTRRGPGRPRRADGLDPVSTEARRLRREAAGLVRVEVMLPAGVASLLSGLAARWGVSRAIAVARLVEAEARPLTPATVQALATAVTPTPRPAARRGRAAR